jgi:hypothetical protein
MRTTVGEGGLFGLAFACLDKSEWMSCANLYGERRIR